LHQILYEMKELTKAEEQVMHILWDLEKAFVKDVVEQMPSPKPAYNTVSTIIRILERKGFVGYTAYGKTHEYYPLVSKQDYTKGYLKNFMRSYFGNSFRQLVSFFAKDENLTVEEMEGIIKLLTEELKKQKNHGNE